MVYGIQVRNITLNKLVRKCCNGNVVLGRTVVCLQRSVVENGVGNVRLCSVQVVSWECLVE